MSSKASRSPRYLQWETCVFSADHPLSCPGFCREALVIPFPKSETAVQQLTLIPGLSLDPAWFLFVYSAFSR